MLLLILQHTCVILYNLASGFLPIFNLVEHNEVLNVGNALTDLCIVIRVHVFLPVLLMSDGTDLVEGFLLTLVHLLH